MLLYLTFWDQLVWTLNYLIAFAQRLPASCGVFFFFKELSKDFLKEIRIIKFWSAVLKKDELKLEQMHRRAMIRKETENWY